MKICSLILSYFLLRPTNNPTGDLEAISHSKETFVKAAMIRGVGSVDRKIESALQHAKISMTNFVCFYYKVKNTITTHNQANCCLMVRKIGLKVQNGEVGVDEDDMLMVIMMIVAKDEISVRRFTWALAGCGWVRRDAQSSFC